MIAEKAGKGKVEQETLTRAVCYAVKCWAEYPAGSDERNGSFISEVEAAQLKPQLD
ncbi:hypothetical protein ACN22W_17890 [Burkholderia theae]|uniref:Uncharacterized protein n=1 Tax=Burkholderia theae TaxID=3143496 RepID=A0ABU9WKP0_9BURK